MRVVVLQRSVTNQRIFHNVLAKGDHGPIQVTAEQLEDKLAAAASFSASSA